MRTHLTGPKILGTVAHRLALLAYIVFALFPLFWLLKVSVTPNKLLYSEGVRMWPSETTWEHYAFVLRHSAFPTFFIGLVLLFVFYFLLQGGIILGKVGLIEPWLAGWMPLPPWTLPSGF